jgi:uncharacterized protein (DUF302 family)
MATICIAADGLVEVKSPYSAPETMNRLEEIVKQRGLNVFARIDHAAGAGKAGRSLRPTELLIFGNPQGGTPLKVREGDLCGIARACHRSIWAKSCRPWKPWPDRTGWSMRRH